MSSKYIISNHQEPHFITFAVVEWVDALCRPCYKDILVDSLRHCQQNKGLILYAWVIMSNHVHLIASADYDHNLSDILRDMKKFTGKRLTSAIRDNPRESRRRWMMWIFTAKGLKNSNNKTYQFWQQDNRPIELSSPKMVEQRLDYLHNTIY